MAATYPHLKRSTRAGLAARLAPHFVLIAYCLVALFPIVLIIMNSFKSREGIFGAPFQPPTAETFSLIGYQTVFGRANFPNYFLNSLIVTGTSLLLILFFGSMAAFALSQYHFRGDFFVGIFLALGIMVPIRLGTIGILRLIVSLGLANTLVALILVYIAQGLPLTIFILTQFYRQIPHELTDAARMDGASEYYLYRLLTPLVRPAIGAIGIFTMIPIWNDLWFPLILAPNDKTATVTLGTQQFLGQFVSDWNAVLAALTLAMVPILLMYVLFSRQMVRSVTAGAISNMRVGIVGVGSMGAIHAAGWTETPADITGFVAEHPDEAARLAEQYHARVFPTLDALSNEVDVVDLCTLTHLHYEQVLQAAAHGKHIICEKPLARTLEQGLGMLEACQAAHVKLYIAHVVRFFPEYALAKNQVDSGAIGKPAVIRLAREAYRPKKPVGNWFLDFEKSGGILLDLMIHDFDYARWVGGEVSRVFAKNVSTRQATVPLDYGLAILTHKNGALSHIVGAWAYPPPNFRTGIEIAGDAGLIEWKSAETTPIETFVNVRAGDAPDVGLPSSPLRASPYTTQLQEFYEGIVKDRPTRVTAADGLAALQIALAAIESARTGEPVGLEPLAGVSG